MYRIYFFLISFLSFLNGFVYAENILDVRRGFQDRVFLDNAFIYTDCSHLDPQQANSITGKFIPLGDERYAIPSGEQGCFFWLRFTLTNSGETDQVLFYSSGTMAQFQVYRIEGASLKALSAKEQHYQMIQVSARDTVQLLVKNYFPLSGTRMFLFPYLVDVVSRVAEDPADYLEPVDHSFTNFLSLFMGMSAMMGLYLLISYFQVKDRSFLYYSLSIFSLVALVLVRIICLEAEGTKLLDYYALLTPQFQLLSHLFYFLFATYFLRIREYIPELYRFIRYVVIFLAVYLLADLIIFFSGSTIAIRNQMFLWIRIILILIAFGCIYYAQKRSTPLVRLFAIGTFLMVVFAATSMALSYWPPESAKGLLAMPFVIFLIGYLIDHLFFTVCLGYKSRLEQQEKLALQTELIERKALEQEKNLRLVMQTQEQERNRMAEDLHDELGSGLSTIRFLIESMKIKGESVPPAQLHFISLKSAEIIENMRQIIWAVNPEHDNLADLLFYMKRYSGEFLEANKIDWDFIMQNHVPDRKLPPGLRRNLFAILKEALHNVSRHSGASRATVEFNYVETPNGLDCSMIIRDNGSGFEPGKVYEGNGLKNMKRRMREAGGTINVIRNEDGPGSTLILSFNIP